MRRRVWSCYTGDVSPELEWRRSTFCADNACVEVAATADQVLLRDSKNPHQPPVAFHREEWAAFLAHLTAGRYS